jgi:class 3 adenylate cyclase
MNKLAIKLQRFFKSYLVNASIVAFTVFFLLAGLGTAVGLLWQARNTALLENANQAVRFTEGAVAAFNRTLIGLDVMLVSMIEPLETSTKTLNQINSATASQLLVRTTRQQLMIPYVALIDSQSKVFASSLLTDVNSRLPLPKGFVEIALAQPSSQLVISAPTQSIVTAEQVLYIARYISLKDNTNVLVIAEVQLAALTAIMLQGVNIDGLETTVERANGELVASAPVANERIETSKSNNLLTLQNALDAQHGAARLSGLPALVTARPILYGNIFLTASIPIESALKAWRELRNLIIAASVLFALMTIGAGMTWVWYNNRMTRARKTVAIARKNLEQTNQHLAELAGKLSKYLSPQLYQAIFKGEKQVKIELYRKRLTLMFSDIVNFTPTTESMEPMALAAWLNSYLNDMAEIVQDFGGTLDKFIGDAVMVFFGDPQSQGEKQDAITCVKMAIQMCLKAKAKGVIIRIGINTGEGIVGNFGSEARMDYTVIGKDVNVASRLESSAVPGQILISESTYELVKDVINCVPNGLVKLKGIDRSILTYWVTAPIVAPVTVMTT